MPRRHICYIVNPISGTGSKDALQNKIAKETLREGVRFSFYPSVANGDYSFLYNIIQEDKITDVVIAGGDGTVSQVIDGLKHLPVRFGIIPSGSGNGLAFGAGIAKSISKALQTVFQNYAMAIDGFRINGKFACMLCGVGFDGEIAHAFATQSKRGLSTYLNQIFNRFFSAKSYPFEIILTKNSFKTEAYFISIANSNQFGNHVTIAPQASLNDGLLDVVIAADQPKIALLFNTLMQVGGLNKAGNGALLDKNKSIIYFQTDELTIINSHEAPMHIDGEPVMFEKNLHIKVEKKAFKLLINPS